MFKAKYHLLPVSCMKHVTASDLLRPYLTRKSNYFVEEFCRTVVRENSVNIHGPKLWNSLSPVIQKGLSLGALKKDLVEMNCGSYVS